MTNPLTFSSFCISLGHEIKYDRRSRVEIIMVALAIIVIVGSALAIHDHTLPLKNFYLCSGNLMFAAGVVGLTAVALLAACDLIARVVHRARVQVFD